MLTISPRLIRTLAIVPIAWAGIALIGWQLRIPLLKEDMFGTFVAPNTALCFIVCGASILLQLSRPTLLRHLGVALGVCVALFAAATLAEYVFGFDLGIDRVFFAH